MIYLGARLFQAGSATLRYSIAMEIEISEHPQRLIVWCDEKGHLHLTFRDSEVIAQSLPEFKRVLKQRARDFLNQMPSIPGKPDPQQEEIRAFVEFASYGYGLCSARQATPKTGTVSNFSARKWSPSRSGQTRCPYAGPASSIR